MPSAGVVIRAPRKDSSGFKAVNMSWDTVCRDYILPGMARASKGKRLKAIA